MTVPIRIQTLYRENSNSCADQLDRATVSDVNELEALLAKKLPAPYRNWLLYMDNDDAGAGYLYGLKGDSSIFDILHEYPQWIEKQWVPVANDGCGNKYVMMIGHSSGFDPIAIIYDSIDPDTPGCVVNSNLYSFLEGFLEDGLMRPDDCWWHRDRDSLVAMDPQILQITGLPFPWDEAPSPKRGESGAAK